VVADRARVTQLVTHLVRNALDYSPHNTPVVLVWGAAPGTHEAVIHVSDQGAGLSSFQQEALYDGVTAMGSPGNRGGLGLGLYLARALARAHGGESTLAQTGPAGSTFEARLPLAPAHPREGVTE
jgi:signal transduction histidine kinase